MTLDEFRRYKDDFFRSTESPLTPEQRMSFTSLNYFPENAALRFELALDASGSHDEVTMDTSTGARKKYQRAGTITFTVNGTDATLTVFVDSHGYFMPFRDATGKDESYGAGRYLEPRELPDGKLLVDFNFCYNPYCAYNEHYSCPIPPKENWLTVPIAAGEKKYHT